MFSLKLNLNLSIFLTVIIVFFILDLTANAVTVIAHRGLPKYFPEHTKISLVNALQAKPDFVEADLVLTKDKKLVVLHDLTLDATSNVKTLFKERKRADGKYYAIDFNLAELKNLDISQRVNPKTGKPQIAGRSNNSKNIQKILTFEEFTKLVLNFNLENSVNIGIYPELKDPEFHFEEGIKDTLVIFAKALNHVKLKNSNLPITAQCFHYESLKRLRWMLLKKIELTFLYGENSWNISSTNYEILKKPESANLIKQNASNIGVWLGHIFNKSGKYKPWVKSMREMGLKVHVYTVRNDALPSYVKNEAHLLSLLTQYGIDGVFSDSVLETKVTLATIDDS